MEYVVGILEAVTKDFLRKIVFMAMGKCFGLTGIFTEDGGIIMFKMEKDNSMSKVRD